MSIRRIVFRLTRIPIALFERAFGHAAAAAR
jgi:hypothetical protein